MRVSRGWDAALPRQSDTALASVPLVNSQANCIQTEHRLFFFFFPRDEWCPSPGNGHICSPGVASGACCTCFHQKERWCNCFTGSEQLRQFNCSGLILFEVVSGPGSNGTGRTRVSNSAVLPHRQSQPNTVWIKPQPCPGRPHIIWEFWLDSLLFDAHRAEGSRRLIRKVDCLAAVTMGCISGMSKLSYGCR